MLDKKMVVFPGIGNVEGNWANDTHDDKWMEDKVRPFFVYADYYESHNKDPAKYSAAWDWYGPQFWAPSQCIRYFDWAKPPKSSPIIAMIGDQSNITDSVSQYIQGLKNTQYGTAAVLAVPNYRTIWYDTVDELNEYIASPDYKIDQDHKGVCFGMQHFV